MRTTNRVFATCLLSLGATVLSGCLAVSQKRSGYAGNTPDLSKQNVTDFVTTQTELVRQFATLGGLDKPPAHGKDWQPVVNGGMQYVDVRCARFMDALFWLNRARETTSHQIQYVGAATSAIMAIANASKSLIGIAPLGFGLADQTVNNVGQGLLYNLDPGTVAGLVARQQGTFRDAIKDVKYSNRAAALTAIQSYAALCLPVNIEGEVNRAIENSEFKRVDYRIVRTVPEQPADEPGSPADNGTPPPPLPPENTGSNENLIPTLEQRPPQGS